MFFKKMDNYFLLTTILVIYITAWMIQSRLLINWDSSLLMREAKLLLAGGNYVSDFFELNPPMSIYLYLFPVILTKIFHLSVMLALRIYVFLLATLSLAMCYLTIKKIFSPRDAVVSYLFFTALMIVFLIFPMMDFSEREHLLVIFTMPYFLVIATRLQGGMVNTGYGVVVGILAGIGFAIKPFFLIVFVFTELYYSISTKNRFGWVRAETKAIIFLLLIYVLSVFILYKNYLDIVVPITLRFYYQSVSDPWKTVLLHPVVLFCYYMVGLFFLIHENKNPYKALASILLIALVGYLLAYFLQRTAWAYHQLPAVSMAILLGTLLFGIAVIRLYKSKTGFCITPILASAIFAFPVYVMNSDYLNSLAYKNDHNNFIDFLHAYAWHKSICSFQTSALAMFPFVDYADVSFVCRNSALSWVPNAVRQTSMSRIGNSDALQQKHKDEIFLVNMVSEDLNTRKPDFVLVDVSNKKFFPERIAFSYLKYLSGNKEFQAAWKKYVYLITVAQGSNDTFRVYQRIDR